MRIGVPKELKVLDNLVRISKGVDVLDRGKGNVVRRP